VAERRRSGVTEAFSGSGRCRGRANVRLLRAVLVALLNVVRVYSPAHSALSSSSRASTTVGAGGGAGVGWALATATPPPIAPAASAAPTADTILSFRFILSSPFPWLSRLTVVPSLSSGPVTSLSLRENVSRNTQERTSDRVRFADRSLSNRLASLVPGC